MVKWISLLCTIILSGCSSYEDAHIARDNYVRVHRYEIRQSNRNLLQSKIKENLPFGEPDGFNTIVSNAAVRLICGDDQNEIMKEVAEFVRKSGEEVSDKDLSLLKETILLLKKQLPQEEINSCEMFEFALSRGGIVEGMTIEQVEAAWQRPLRFLWSGSGYSTYEARMILQKDSILDNGSFTISYTFPGRDYRDFHVTFYRDVLTEISSFPMSSYVY